MPPTEPAEAEPEVVDGVPVLAEPASVAAARPATEVAVQAAAVAGASFVAGAGVVALLRSRKARKSALKLARAGRGRAAGGPRPGDPAARGEGPGAREVAPGGRRIIAPGLPGAGGGNRRRAPPAGGVRVRRRWGSRWIIGWRFARRGRSGCACRA